MNLSDPNDLAQIALAIEKLKEVLDNPSKFSIVETEANLGSARQKFDAEEHSVQRLHIVVQYVVNS